MSQHPTIAAIGELLVEFVSHSKNCGLRRIGDYSGPYPSGAPAIFLDQVARMGGKTEMIGGVGKDGFGDTVIARLTADGVGTGGVTRAGAHSTGVAFVSYYETGARDFIFHLNNTAADQFHVPDTLLDLANTHLHISAASLGNHALRHMIMTTMRQVDTQGGWISCDPNARPELMRDTAVREALEEVMQRSRYLLPSTSDLGFLFPDLSEEAAIDRLLSAKPEVIALKRGAKGATVVGFGERHDFAAHTVPEIDPTGAGDCFGGTFIALVTQGASLRIAGEKANAAGALAVTKRGPMEGNSNPDDIDTFLRDQGRGDFT
ncbi:Tagatose kinase [Roseobacter fucihabitans]|uniref:Tagatose kinase n=1 Tax=Roseobacter fucihabitans TaxID=1537242 RepID=A0ABZ2BQR5_9RHOB|nr:sugar kinase [Roseobacter litoralis]MBC6963732.1 2-dehydro-3-deoxygluconokinase [Roseobacter litoralis]